MLLLFYLAFELISVHKYLPIYCLFKWISTYWKNIFHIENSKSFRRINYFSTEHCYFFIDASQRKYFSIIKITRRYFRKTYSQFAMNLLNRNAISFVSLQIIYMFLLEDAVAILVNLTQYYIPVYVNGISCRKFSGPFFGWSLLKLSDHIYLYKHILCIHNNVIPRSMH